jgi:hypothetical protein
VKDITEVLKPESLAGLRVETVKESPKYMNILVYGESGVGKTTLAGSADAVPEMRPVLFIDIEGGTLSLSHAYPNVRKVRVKTWKELQAVYNELHSRRHDYQTVVIDSLTETQKFSMMNIMTDLTRMKPDADPDVPGMREWGKNIEQVRRFVRGFRDLPMNTIFTSLVKADKDSKTGKVTKKPYLNGKLADEVAGFLDVVVYAYAKQVSDGDDVQYKRLLLTAATDENVAKDRTGSLPMVIEEPTMAKLHELMANTPSNNNNKEGS